MYNFQCGILCEIYFYRHRIYERNLEEVLGRHVFSLALPQSFSRIRLLAVSVMEHGILRAILAHVMKLAKKIKMTLNSSRRIQVHSPRNK